MDVYARMIGESDTRAAKREAVSHCPADRIGRQIRLNADATQSQNGYNPRMATPSHGQKAPSQAQSAQASDSITALTDLPAGATAVVTRIDEQDHAMLIRLKTMGMHEGRAVRMIRQGTRVIVSCGGTRLGLSSQVARYVLVSPTEGMR